MTTGPAVPHGVGPDGGGAGDGDGDEPKALGHGHLFECQQQDASRPDESEKRAA